MQIKQELGTLKSLSKAASSTDFPKAKWGLGNTCARQAERDKREARKRDDGDDWGRGSVQGIQKVETAQGLLVGDLVENSGVQVSLLGG